jgi:D-glycero-alpha-D-manno-heptose 1-phosphate guanylyltransferase
MADVVVLAGGLGTRLRGVVPDLPKPLAPVAGRPFLGWLLPHLIADGVVDRIILSIGYRGDDIEASIGYRLDGVPIDYVREAVPLGTGGALRQALRLVEGPDAIVANGDTFADCDMRQLMNTHHSLGRTLTLTLANVAETARYGSVTVDGSRVTGFASKGGTEPGLINAGIYAMRTNLLRDIAIADPFSFEGDFMVPAVDQIQPAFMHLSGRFIDIGVPEDFAAAQTLFARPLQR